MGELGNFEDFMAGKTTPPASIVGGRGMETPVPGEFVNTEAVKADIARACGDLPAGVQSKIYAERVAAEADDRADISRLYSGDPRNL